jgi:hypothetical protein
MEPFTTFEIAGVLSGWFSSLPKTKDGSGVE